MHVNNLLV